MNQTRYRIGYDSVGPSSIRNWEKIKNFFKQLVKIPEFMEMIEDTINPEYASGQ